MEKLTVDERTLAWWNSLDERHRLIASDEARCYESLSEEGRNSFWNEGAESIRAEAEHDEIDLRTGATQ